MEAVFDPGTYLETITEIWAFVASDHNGEGVVGMKIRDTWMPLIAADRDRLEGLRPMAMQIAVETGKTIKLVKFTTREEVETIAP